MSSTAEQLAQQFLEEFFPAAVYNTIFRNGRTVSMPIWVAQIYQQEPTSLSIYWEKDFFKKNQKIVETFASHYRREAGGKNYTFNLPCGSSPIILKATYKDTEPWFFAESDFPMLRDPRFGNYHLNRVLYPSTSFAAFLTCSDGLEVQNLAKEIVKTQRPANVYFNRSISGVPQRYWP